mgnify:CR=1 FL=1
MTHSRRLTSAVEIGPLLPSIHHADAAPPLHQTGHSSMAQHFRRIKVGRADLAAIRCSCSIAVLVSVRMAPRGGKQSFAASSMNGANAWKSTTAAAHGVFWRSRMGCGTRIDSDRYYVTLSKNMTVEDVLIE